MLAGVAPVALACYALPQTQAVAGLWWRPLLGRYLTRSGHSGGAGVVLRTVVVGSITRRLPVPARR